MRREIQKLNTILTTVMLVAFIVIPAVYGQPRMPHQFYGTAKVAGVPAVDGTLVEAKIEGLTWNTTTLDGKYGYEPVFYIAADDPDTAEKDGGEAGDTIDFYLTGHYIASSTFINGAVTELNLTIASLPPVAEADGPYTGIEGQPVTFNGSASTDPDGTIVSYQWDFGDQETGFGVNAIHTYQQDGNYTATLTVTDNSGVNATDTATVTVEDTEPVADFSGTPIVGSTPLYVSFTDKSISHDGVTDWLWSFGDNTTSTEKNPGHTYIGEGTYTVSLNVTEADGDWDVETKPNYVLVTPTEIAAPINVMMDAGSIHFPGETAEFYIFTLNDKGLPVNVEFLHVKLFYHNEEIPLAAPENIELGVYRASYEIPENAPAVTYTLITEVRYVGPEGTSYGGAVKSFQVSPTLNGLNASITKIEDDVATIVVPGLTEIKANLTAINAKLVDIQGTTASINSTLGLIKTDITNINTYLASLNGTIATISSDVGEIKTDVDAIHLKVVDVDWETKIADIQTTLGTIEGYVEDVDDGGLATINTDLGNVTTNIFDILTSSQDIQNTANTLTTIVYAALAFSILAFLAAITTAYMLRSKLA